MVEHLVVASELLGVVEAVVLRLGADRLKSLEFDGFINSLNSLVAVLSSLNTPQQARVELGLDFRAYHLVP